MKYIIYAPPYDSNSGGSIALHKLCDTINKVGGDAVIFPSLPSYELHPYMSMQASDFLREILSSLKAMREDFKINKDFNTPVLWPELNFVAPENSIVIYPEITFGNPLQAKNVVRWLLYYPGFHTGKIYYSQGELIVPFYRKYNTYSVPQSVSTDIDLPILHYPFEIYTRQKKLDFNSRSEVAYSIRKGSGRKIIHNLDESICIDGKTHEEIAKIFSKSRLFISYDMYSAYSMFAVLSGCDSVVVPEEGISRKDWCADPEMAHGIAYGFEEIEEARSKKELMLQRCMYLEHENVNKVNNFMLVAHDFFAEKLQSNN